MDIDDLDVAREEEVRPGDEGQVHGNPLPGENSNSDQFSKEITEKPKSKEFVIKLSASKKGLLSAVFGTVVDSSNQKPGWDSLTETETETRQFFFFRS